MGPILGWQAVVIGLGAALLSWLGRGSVPSLLLGGGIMLSSMVLQRFSLSMALQPGRRPAIGVLLLFLKLAGLMLLIYIGFHTSWLAPMSFAAGVTTLPVAIVLDVCYLEWVVRRSSATSPEEDAG